jgi:dipeptidyl aminopeptidase/acylaminoacyl peptidase
MRSMMLFFLMLSGTGSVITSYAQQGNEPVLVTDLLKIKTAGSVTVTKDGSRAAFTVTSIIPDEANKLDYKFQTQIFSVTTADNDGIVQLTTLKDGASQPSWSHDGTQLAFVRPVDGKSQIFLLSLKGGEARQLTKSKYGATSPKWSPDGKSILFASDISLKELVQDTLLNQAKAVPLWPSEKPGFAKNEHWKPNGAKADPNGSIDEVRAYLSKNVADKKAVVLNKLNFQDEMNISDDMTISYFFVIDTQGNSEPRLLTKDFNRYNSADFLPDGKQIIVSGDVDSLETPDRSLENEIFIVNIQTAKQRLLLGERGKRYTSAMVSPSGRLLAFLRDSTNFPSVPSLGILPISGSRKDMVIIPFDRNISSLAWSPDERYLYFTASSNGGVPLYRVALATRKIEMLSNFDTGISGFAVAKDKIVFTKISIESPSELYIADAALRNEKKLSDLNGWIRTKKLSIPEKKTFTNEKGLQIEYWSMKPSNYRPGQKYPLLLEIHGGPSAMWGPGEASMWHEFQYFCSKGYGIVYSNPRGSGGYGLEFMRSNVKDWSRGPAKDVLTALEKTTAEGWADTSRLLITGGSYAGYLTAWIISHDNRFKAACSQRGVYDLSTFFGEGNAWRIVPNYFGGFPWEPETKEILIRESPISYVQNIRTPYIIFHGSNDRRTGFVQGEMMYRSLKVLNRSVEYVVHPGASHEITRSGDNRQRIDQMLRTYEFFDRWIGPKAKDEVKKLGGN